MYKVFLPSISSGVIPPKFGVVSGVDPGQGIPWYNYICDKCVGGGEYFSMIWSASSPEPGPECAGKPLLLLNEPEYPTQANNTPAEGAELLYRWRNWSGPLYGFGTSYTAAGWNWWNACAVLYADTYGLPLPLTGIHLHAYSFNNLRSSDFAQWRKLADSYGLSIIVTEIGHLPFGATTAEDIAATLPGILDMTIAELRPTHIFWFSMKDTGVEYNDGFHWKLTALYDVDGETVVGEAWRRYTNWGYEG